MDLGKRCGAVYVCPKINGVRKGPLVAYAGKDETGRNLVGDIYFNFAQIETHPKVVMAFANEVRLLLDEADLLGTFDTICGVPEGGRTFGQALALLTDKRFVYAGKSPKITEAGKKLEYDWDLSRFTFEKGERVALAEDVFNNFQNTTHTVTQVAQAGAVVHALVGALNRSPFVRDAYTLYPGSSGEDSVKVIAAINEAYPEYTQDDPEVADDIATGNLELYVKKNWAKLQSVMQQYA